MKKSLLIAAAVMFVASSSFAIDLPPVGYIGLFKDAAHDPNPPINGSDYWVCPAQYGNFQCWIWCLPSHNGLQAAEFAVSFPATVVTLATVQNPLITVALGSLAAGISVAFGEGSCQQDWVWLHQLTMMQLGPPVLAAKIDIIPHPGTLPVPAYQFATCEAGYPIEPCIYLVPLYICWPPDWYYGVQQSNWGAIKSLF
ncbi:MAG: hypothetical protein NTW97_06405 [Candidatus Krumholzibacteria bacterium]|nr:hypothetical protein [Candidatus Krumholzibacteria bacterium]